MEVYVLYRCDWEYQGEASANVLGVFTDRKLADEYAGVCNELQWLDEDAGTFEHSIVEVRTVTIDDPKDIKRVQSNIEAVKNDLEDRKEEAA